MEDISFEEAGQESEKVFPGSIDAGQIQDLFYGHLMVIHTTTGHRLVIHKEDDIKRLMTACAVLLDKVHVLKDI